MVQDHAWVKDPFKVQDRKMDFNTTENEQFLGIIPRPTLQLAFEKLLSRFDIEEQPQFLIKTIRTVIFFPATYLCEPRFPHMRRPNLSRHVS